MKPKREHAQNLADLPGLGEEKQGKGSKLDLELTLPELSSINVLDGQHRIFSLQYTMKNFYEANLENKTQNRVTFKPANKVHKKRQATKSVARLDNTRRSNVSEWSNHNNNR